NGPITVEVQLADQKIYSDEESPVGVWDWGNTESGGGGTDIPVKFYCTKNFHIWQGDTFNNYMWLYLDPYTPPFVPLHATCGFDFNAVALKGDPSLVGKKIHLSAKISPAVQFKFNVFAYCGTTEFIPTYNSWGIGWFKNSA